MSTKHTPGPWEVGEDCGIARRCIVTSECRDVCRCETAFGDDEANARLIAAAPELLEACRRLMADVQTALNWHVDHQQCGGECIYCRNLRVAQAAIAKAEGRE